MSCCFSKKRPNLQRVTLIEYCMEGVDEEDIEEKMGGLFAQAEESSNLSKLIKAKDEYGRSPLQICAYYGSVHVMKYIISYWNDKGHDLKINREDNDGYSALFLACLRGYTNQVVLGETEGQDESRQHIVKMLLEQEGCDPNFVVKGTLMTPLHWACYYKDITTIDLLIQKGAILKFDFQECTPIDVAGYSEHKKVVNLLIQKFLRDTDLETLGASPIDSVSGSKSRIAPINSQDEESQEQLDDEGNRSSSNISKGKGKNKVHLKAVSMEDISGEMQPFLRMFYWAAYFGFEDDVDVFIRELRWSPFIKSYKRQNSLSGAMRGGRIEAAKLILSYDYQCDPSREEDLQKSRKNKDITLNTSFHYSYLNEEAEYRECLRENQAADEDSLNRRGKTAKAFSHKLKFDSEDEEINEEEDEEERNLRRKQELLITPDYVFICRNKTAYVLKRNLDALAELDVTYQSIPNEKGDRILVCVFFSNETYDTMAEMLKVKTRLKMYDYMCRFRGYASELYEQFNSRQAQFIMMETFKRTMDIDYLMKARIIEEHYPLHTAEREHIRESWQKYSVRLMTGFVTGSWMKSIQPLNFIAEYYGEKMGFYFAWLIHYTAWLFILAIFGVIAFMIQTIQYLGLPEEEKAYINAYDGNVGAYYAIIVGIWATAFVESWKRKQNILSDTWLVRDFQDKTTVRKDYKSSYYVNQSTKKMTTIDFANQYLRMLAGYPITLFFIALVITANLINRVWSDDLTEQIKNGEITGVAKYQSYVPATINACIIVLFENIYFAVALRQCKMENHKYESQYENSLILKVYSFYFINSNCSNFIYAFYSRNILLLAQNLAIILLFKQVLMNILEYFYRVYFTGKNIKKMEDRYQEKIDEEIAKGEGNKEKLYLLKLAQFVEPQTIMSVQSDTLVKFYQEGMTQLTYIALFSYSLTLGAIFSWITNLIEIRIKLNDLSHYKRRFESAGAPNIGSWTQSMEFISFICIPINMAVMYFIGTPSRIEQILAYANPERWNAVNVVLLLVLIEHILIAFKLIIAQAIPDVPQIVLDSEQTRDEIESVVEYKIKKLKNKKQALSYQDIIFQKQQMKIAEQNLEESQNIAKNETIRSDNTKPEGEGQETTENTENNQGLKKMQTYSTIMKDGLDTRLKKTKVQKEDNSDFFACKKAAKKAKKEREKQRKLDKEANQAKIEKEKQERQKRIREVKQARKQGVQMSYMPQMPKVQPQMQYAQQMYQNVMMQPQMQQNVMYQQQMQQMQPQMQYVQQMPQTVMMQPQMQQVLQMQQVPQVQQMQNQAAQQMQQIQQMF